MRKMKNSFFLLLLFIGFCICTKYNSHVKEGSRGKHDDEGNPIEYPCPVSDLKCIRKFFYTHGRCRHVHDPVTDNVLIDHLTFRLATSNISAEVINAEITNFNGNVTSFYINKKTDNLIIAFEVKNMTLASPQIAFIYHPVGKEPIKLTDYFTITYGFFKNPFHGGGNAPCSPGLMDKAASVIFTGVIPKIKDLQLYRADAYAYLNDSNPKYKLGPGLGRNSKDPLISKAYCDVNSKMPANAKEALVIQAVTFMKLYIEINICNFGLHIMN